MGTQASKPSEASKATQHDARACPVDHAAREAYLSAAASKPAPPAPKPIKITEIYGFPTDNLPLRSPTSSLDESRVVSSIPRASTSPETATPNPNSPPSASPPRASSIPSSGPDQSNWIYPSERMFFDAMRRKSYSPSAPDMSTIVPIHNAVNERAWTEILAWERSNARLTAENKACGGPKLRSFSGDSGRLSPRARWKMLVGYERPFDRHDWVVERCVGNAEGKQALVQSVASAGHKGEQPKSVEYVIDFYRGKGGADQKVSFYLDVRPKLNTWEGWRMRVGRWIGVG